MSLGRMRDCVARWFVGHRADDQVRSRYRSTTIKDVTKNGTALKVHQDLARQAARSHSRLDNNRHNH